MIKNNINELTVLFNKKEVGKLSLKDNIIYFQYSNEWIKNGFTISPFKLPLTNDLFSFEQSFNKEIWGVFNDCPPDGWGIRLSIKECAKNNINYEKLNILEKLSLTNQYSLGGLEFKPSNSLDLNTSLALDDIAKDIMQNYHNLDSLINLDSIYNLGGSSGGARPKIHLKNDEGNWIIKFPRSNDDINIGINEFKANEIAKLCGINVNEFKLFKSNICPGYFGAKRFDIDENNIRKHTITIAGLLDIDFRIASIDYLTIFEIIKMISVDKESDYYEMFRRMVFNYEYGNKDDHTKNTSFIYDEKLKGYKLSPAYDTTKTPELDFHNMLCNSKENPTIQDFLNIANKLNLNENKCKEVIDNIKLIIRNN